MVKLLLKSMAFVGLTSSVAYGITITKPVANQVVDQKNLTLVVEGACRANLHVKLDATDPAGKVTSLVWAMCTAKGTYWAQVPLAALKDGNISVRAFQVYNNVTEQLRRNVVKKTTGAVVTPSPVPSPSPSASATVKPGTSGKVVFGINGHDGRKSYPLNLAEARFKILNERNLRSYRFDIDPRNFTVLDELVRLSKKYNITLRPMVYPMSADIGATLAQRYGGHIKIWEIANEQDFSKSGAQARINAMTTMYKGMKSASDRLGLGLKFTINVMACNSDDRSATARCPGDRNGAVWFTDMAKASGFNFDYVSFHYYPFLSDKGYWMDMYMSQTRAFAKRYNTKIFFNEVNCADVYKGNQNGGYPGDKGCYDSVKQILEVIRTQYSDVIAEVNMYEMVNEPEIHGVEGHFGLMYNINSAKPTMNLLTEFARK